MPVLPIPKFNFTKSWRNAVDFPTIEESEERVRDDLQILHDEVRDFINGPLADKIKEMFDASVHVDSFPVASEDGVGGVKIGPGLAIGEDGVLTISGAHDFKPKKGVDYFTPEDIDELVNDLYERVGKCSQYDVLPVANGGTGSDTAAGARTNLGLGALATLDNVPVANGGTGATTAANARTNLGLKALATLDTAPVANGGTGATTAAGARTNLGLGALATLSTATVARGGTGATKVADARTNLGVGYTLGTNYFKHDSGLLICWGTQSIPKQAAGGAWGDSNLSWANYNTKISFPVAFVAAPAVSVVAGNGTSATEVIIGKVLASTSGITSIVRYRATSMVGSGFDATTVQWIAVGKWK